MAIRARHYLDGQSHSLALWGVLCDGKIRTNAGEARRKESGEKGRTILNTNLEHTPEEKKVCRTRHLGLEKITVKQDDHESITAGMCHKFCFLFRAALFKLTQITLCLKLPPLRMASAEGSLRLFDHCIECSALSPIRPWFFEQNNRVCHLQTRSCYSHSS